MDSVSDISTVSDDWRPRPNGPMPTDDLLKKDISLKCSDGFDNLDISTPASAVFGRALIVSAEEEPSSLLLGAALLTREWFGRTVDRLLDVSVDIIDTGRGLSWKVKSGRRVTGCFAGEAGGLSCGSRSIAERDIGRDI